MKNKTNTQCLKEIPTNLSQKPVAKSSIKYPKRKKMEKKM